MIAGNGQRSEIFVQGVPLFDEGGVGGDRRHLGNRPTVAPGSRRRHHRHNGLCRSAARHYYGLFRGRDRSN